MLPGIAGGIQAGLAGLYDISYLSYAAGGSGSSVTFTAYGLGAAHTARRIFIGIHWRETTVHRTVSSVTIGGVSATIHEQEGHTGGATGFGAAIASAIVPSGTSGDVVVNFSGSQSECNISGIRAVGLFNSSPTEALTDTTSGTSNNLSVAIDIPASGFCMAVFTSSTNAAGDAVTWAGVTEEYDTNSGVRESMAWSAGMAAETNRTVSATVGTQADSGNGMVVVSWG
jgi:hypothetical protein